MGSQVKVPMGIPALRPGRAPPGVDLGRPVWDPQAGPGEVVELRTTAFPPPIRKPLPSSGSRTESGTSVSRCCRQGARRPAWGSSWSSSFGLNFNISGLFPVCRESSVNG